MSDRCCIVGAGRNGLIAARAEQRWERQEREHHPALSDVAHVDSPRHLHHVDTARCQQVLREICAEYGRPPVDDTSHDDLRVASAGVRAVSSRRVLDGTRRGAR